MIGQSGNEAMTEYQSMISDGHVMPGITSSFLVLGIDGHVMPWITSSFLVLGIDGGGIVVVLNMCAHI